jgi:hypothetical protein
MTPKELLDEIGRRYQVSKSDHEKKMLQLMLSNLGLARIIQNTVKVEGKPGGIDGYLSRHFAAIEEQLREEWEPFYDAMFAKMLFMQRSYLEEATEPASKP